MIREVISFGRRKGDPYVVVLFNQVRGLYRKDLSWADVVYLEDIPISDKGKQDGMVLYHKDWNKHYAVNYRDGWTDDQYFELAESLMKDQK